MTLYGEVSPLYGGAYAHKELTRGMFKRPSPDGVTYSASPYERAQTLGIRLTRNEVGP